MHITNKRLCTNAEAFALLSQKDESQLAVIEKQAKEHLEEYYNVVDYDEAKAKEAICKMKEMNLTRQEIFQMINLQPLKPVELFLVLLIFCQAVLISL